MDNLICRNKVPFKLHSGQSFRFESAVFKKFCKILEIKKIRITPLHSQGDGVVEGFNASVNVCEQVPNSLGSTHHCVPARFQVSSPRNN